MSSHNVFISHRHEDDSLISELKELLSKAGCEVRDSSINADNPNQANDEGYIKSILAERMQWAGKILVIISPQTKYHEWVDWEIEYVNKYLTSASSGCGRRARMAATSLMLWSCTRTPSSHGLLQKSSRLLTGLTTGSSQTGLPRPAPPDH